MQNISSNALLRLPHPKPVKLGPRTTAWRAADIAALLEKLTAEPEEK